MVVRYFFRTFASTLRTAGDRINTAKMSMVQNIINDIVNNSSVSNNFFNLWERWLDECRYEDIDDYGDAMVFVLRKGGLNCAQVSATKRPFGVKVVYQGYTLHFFIKRKSGGNAAFCCKTLVKPAPTVKAVIKQDGDGQRIPWVYAHGELEKDLCTDIFDVNLNGESVRDGLKAAYNGKEVVFHLYYNDFGHLTGVATYADDKVAFAYGRNLVANKPHIF